MTWRLHKLFVGGGNISIIFVYIIMNILVNNVNIQYKFKMKILTISRIINYMNIRIDA